MTGGDDNDDDDDGDAWCVMYDVWCMMCDVWCVMCDVWCVMCDVWCVMCDVQWAKAEDSISTIFYLLSMVELHGDWVIGGEICLPDDAAWKTLSKWHFFCTVKWVVELKKLVWMCSKSVKVHQKAMKYWSDEVMKQKSSVYNKVVNFLCSIVMKQEIVIIKKHSSSKW